VRVNLRDPIPFQTNTFWDIFRRLRHEDPVHWHDDGDGLGFWVLARYRDILRVYTDHDTFSSRFGMRLDSNAAAVSAVAQRMLIVSDPPEHTTLKRVLAKAFTGNELAGIEHMVREVVREVVVDAVGQGELDFLDAARRIPNYVVCTMMGIPRTDWEWLGEVTSEAFEGKDEETKAGAHGEIFLYFSELLDERRREPGGDFVSRIAHDVTTADETGDERGLTDEEIVFNCNGVLAGANETTRYSTAGGLLALIQNPDQWAKLRGGGPDMVRTATDEVLRWTVPGVHAMRTVIRPATVAGVHMAVGDRVTLWNVSANRDEEFFAEPDRFAVDRSPNRHISFGSGRHLCLGARLARMELAAYLSVLVDNVEHAELLGEPVYNDSNFTWGLTSLPVRLVSRRAGRHGG
jgi:cytochrome P450